MPHHAIILYIDPGTGSMLFTVLIGVLSVAFFFVQKLILKVKGFLRGGRADRSVTQKRIPYLIFSDSKRYWNVFRPICEEFEKRETPLVYWTLSDDDPALDAAGEASPQRRYRYVTAEYIGDINRAVTRLNIMNVGVCLSTTPGLDVYQWKRSRNTQHYVHLLHAIGDATAYRMFGLDHYDAVILSGEFQERQIRALEELRDQKPKELKIYGITYMDEMRKRRQQTPAVPHEGRVVLLAPSWGKSSILSRYGEKMIESLIATGYRTIIRPHPQSLTSEKDILEPLQKKYPDSETLSWNYDNDNFDVLNEADIMISDYSGVVWDFALVFDKPVVYADTSFDKAPYDAAWLEEEMWIFRSLPLIGLPLTEEDLPRMKEVLDRAIASEELQAGREQARREGWQGMGTCAEKTAEYMISL